MAPEASQPIQLTAAIAQLSSLARASRDRVWQRELLELAAACSAYAKAPRSGELDRIVAKARSLHAAANQLGQDGFASAATAVIDALTAPPPPTVPAASPPPPPAASPPDGAADPVPARMQAAAVPPVPTAAPSAAPPAPPIPARPDAPSLRPTPPAPPPPPKAPVLDPVNGKTTEPLASGNPASVRPLVLIIDSDAESRRILTTYLDAAGFRAEAFDDGGPALVRIREERPALVVTDLIMPMVPGEVLILALRRAPATGTIPILVVTAEPWRLGPEHEVDAVLTKPVNVTVVVEAARRLVTASAGTDSLHAGAR